MSKKRKIEEEDDYDSDEDSDYNEEDDNENEDDEGTEGGDQEDEFYDDDDSYQSTNGGYPGRRGYHEERNNYENNDEREDDDDEENDSNDEDNDRDKDSDAIYINIDFSNDVTLEANHGGINQDEVSLRFHTVFDIISKSETFLQHPEGKIHVLISNHYTLADIEPLSDLFMNEIKDPKLGLMDRLEGVTFVSCCLFARSEEVIVRFAKSLAPYNLKSFTLDLTSIHSDVQQAHTGEGESSDKDLGLLFSNLIRYVATLESVDIESMGNEGIELICDALINNGNDPTIPPHNNLKILTIHGGSFTNYGFECLANVLLTNTILEELKLPEHTKLTDESLIVLSAPLASNSTLRCLDLHVREYGTGVQQIGIEALLQVLENNPISKLCKLDVSGDDGEPNIESELQKRLTKCLTTISKRNGGKYLKYAKLAAYECHSDNED